MPAILSFTIRQFRLDAPQTWHSQSIHDAVVCEEPLEVWFKTLPKPTSQYLARAVDSKPLLTLMRTPGDDINLVSGWLFTSGLVDKPSQILSIHHSGKDRLKSGESNQIMLTLSADVDLKLAALQRFESANSACGVCGQQSIEDLLLRLEQQGHQTANTLAPLDLKTIIPLVLNLVKQQPLFQQTGGNHGVALFNQYAEIIDIREDVGRHNAFDKVIGANIEQLFKPDESADKLASKPIGAILSGRVGFEMIQKAAMANLRYVFALGAPSSLAIELAKEMDIGLVGFIKDQGFNLYCGEQFFAF